MAARLLTAALIGLLGVLWLPASAQGKPKGGTVFAEFDKTRPLAGDASLRLHLKDSEGGEMDLRDYLGSWVVLEFGSYT